MIYFLFLPKNWAKISRFYPKVGAKHPFSIFPGVSMYRCHLPLKNELVISIDDDGLEIRVMGHQPQITLLTGGCVEGLHRQAAVDEGDYNTTVSWFFETVNQADITVVYTKTDHRLTAHTDEVRCLFMVYELFIKIQTTEASSWLSSTAG